MTRLRGIIAPVIVLLFSSAAFAQSVTGKVVDPDKRPVPGANVLILRGDAVIATTVTAKDGGFGPVNVPEGEYSVTAAAAGLGAAPKSVSVKAGGPTGVDIALSLTAVQESVVVSAAQGETPLSRTTDSVTVVDRAQLETAQIHSVSDALRSVPGFTVVQSGRIGGLTSLFPRGGESDYTLVLVDGVEQNSFGGGFDAAHLDTAALDRIEVIRGPKSALYGNGVIGGVVHLVSRQGGPTRGQFALEGGGYGFMRTTGSASGSQGAFRWGGSIDRLTSDGDTREFASVGGKVKNDDYERTTASGSFGWSDRPSRSIRVDVQGGKNIKGFPGPYGSDPDHLYGGLDTVSRGTNTSMSLGVSGILGDMTRGRHSMQFTSFRGKGEYTSQYGTGTDESGRESGRYQFDREMRKIGLSAGWEFLHEQVDNTYITGTQFQPIPVTRSVSGLFVEGRPALGSDLLLTVGGRLERIARGPLEESAGSHPTLPEDIVWSFNPKIAAAFFVNKDTANWTKIRGSAGTGIKPPTGFEIAYTDNPSLKPERSRSMDAGVEQAIGSAFAVDATYFFNRFDDLIVSVGTAVKGASKYKTDNIANARAQGVELGAQWRHQSGLSVRAGYTGLKTEVLGIDQFPESAPNPYKVGGPLVRRPSHLAFADVTWIDRACTVFFSINGRGSMADLEPNYASTFVTNPGYSTSTLGGSFKFASYVEVFGRVSNLFDKSYEEVFGFPAMGRTASIGVRIAAGK